MRVLSLLLLCVVLLFGACDSFRIRRIARVEAGNVCDEKSHPIKLKTDTMGAVYVDMVRALVKKNDQKEAITKAQEVNNRSRRDPQKSAELLSEALWNEACYNPEVLKAFKAGLN